MGGCLSSWLVGSIGLSVGHRSVGLSLCQAVGHPTNQSASQ